MHFLILATDEPGKLELREKTRPIHRQYLRSTDRHKVKVRLGGPTLRQDCSEMNGTLLVVEAATLEDVNSFIAGDPYSQAGLFSNVEVRPWSWSLGNGTSAA